MYVSIQSYLLLNFKKLVQIPFYSFMDLGTLYIVSQLLMNKMFPHVSCIHLM